MTVLFFCKISRGVQIKIYSYNICKDHNIIPHGEEENEAVEYNKVLPLAEAGRMCVVGVGKANKIMEQCFFVFLCNEYLSVNILLV